MDDDDGRLSVGSRSGNTGLIAKKPELYDTRALPARSSPTRLTVGEDRTKDSLSSSAERRERESTPNTEASSSRHHPPCPPLPQL
jgi:hypothetical protein